MSYGFPPAYLPPFLLSLLLSSFLLSLLLPILIPCAFLCLWICTSLLCSVPIQSVGSPPPVTRCHVQSARNEFCSRPLITWAMKDLTHPLGKKTRLSLASRARDARTYSVFGNVHPLPQLLETGVGRRVGISTGQVSPVRAEVQQGVAGEKAEGGGSDQMVSLMTIRKMAQHHHLVMPSQACPPGHPPGCSH